MMKNKLKVTAVAVAALALATSCGSSKNALQVSALEGEWNIMAVNGQTPEADNTPYYIGMDLQANRLYGFAGCNRIMGKVEAEKAGRLSFAQVASTRMLCPQMETERAVLDALNRVAGYEGTEEELSLTDSEGENLLTLSKRPSSVLASLQGRWDIVRVYGQDVTEIEKTEQPPFLEFDTEQKTVHGNSGCNIVNGSFSQEAGQPASLAFGQLISTMMAGPGLTLERQVLDAMGKVKSFAITDKQTAVLFDENGEQILKLERQ